LNANSQRECQVKYPQDKTVGVMHNVINRVSLASENLFAQPETFPGQSFYLLAMIDESRFPFFWLRECMQYIQDTGYGKDISTGKGAIASCCIEDISLPIPPGANAFISLSSGYVPQAGELDVAPCYYQPYVKYGKLGGDHAVEANPFKYPLVMLRAGAVIGGIPGQHYGGLVENIHKEHAEVVQYGYAFPLWVKYDG